MTLEAIKEEVVKGFNYSDWREAMDFATYAEIDLMADQLAQRYAKAKLEEAAEKATVKRFYQTKFMSGSDEPYTTLDWIVDKESITNINLD